ncbi:hypothetical protein K1719_021439 [Acacia pycnantha]|nr:hypothetical protein K1719_021439 [Acacia pycnantha]
MEEGKPRPTPFEKYPSITEEAWERKAKAIENGSKNDCPNIMSRGGYAKANKDLMEAKQRKLEEAVKEDPSVLLSPTSPVLREETWLYAHQMRSKSYTNKSACKVAQNIDELKKQEAEGDFWLDERNNFLTVAMGKNDHEGTKGSCCVPGHFREGPVGGNEDDHYELHLVDPDRRLVACGSIQNLSPTVHHQELTDGQVHCSKSLCMSHSLLNCEACGFKEYFCHVAKASCVKCSCYNHLSSPDEHRSPDTIPPPKYTIKQCVAHMCFDDDYQSK